MSQLFDFYLNAISLPHTHARTNVGWFSKYKSITIIRTFDSTKTLFDFVAGGRLHGNTTPCRRINICQRPSYHTANNSTCKFIWLDTLSSLSWSFVTTFGSMGMIFFNNTWITKTDRERKKWKNIIKKRKKRTQNNFGKPRSSTIGVDSVTIKINSYSIEGHPKQNFYINLVLIESTTNTPATTSLSISCIHIFLTEEKYEIPFDIFGAWL